MYGAVVCIDYANARAPRKQFELRLGSRRKEMSLEFEMKVFYGMPL